MDHGDTISKVFDDLARRIDEVGARLCADMRRDLRLQTATLVLANVLLTLAVLAAASVG